MTYILILLTQCHLLSRNSDKITKKKLRKSFSSTDHESVPILVLDFEQS